MDNETKGRYALAVMRVCIGWMFLWGFLDKMFGLGFQTPNGMGVIDGVSPSSFVIYASSGIFADLFNSLAGNIVADVLMLSGLLCIGTTLMLGITPKIATVTGTIFFVIMHMVHLPPENNPVLYSDITLSVGLIAIYYLGGFERLSLLDRWRSTALVRKFPILG